jgi:hypothetical protein
MEGKCYGYNGLGGDELKSNIKCEVLNCHYNDRGICEADSIDVKSQGQNSAQSSLGTYCETFIPGDDMDTYME